MLGATVDVPSAVSEACQTPQELTAGTPCKKKLRKLLRHRRESVSRLNKKIRALHSDISIVKGGDRSCRAKKALSLFEGVVSPELIDFMEKQVKLSKHRGKGRRYDTAFKAWSLTLYHISGKAYRFLAKLFNLPLKKDTNSNGVEVRIRCWLL